MTTPIEDAKRVLRQLRNDSWVNIPEGQAITLVLLQLQSAEQEIERLRTALAASEQRVRELLGQLEDSQRLYAEEVKNSDALRALAAERGERIAVLEEILEDCQRTLCANSCPSTWPSDQPRPHVLECVAARNALSPTKPTEAKPCPRGEHCLALLPNVPALCGCEQPTEAGGREEERLYPCDLCPTMRTKAEGGTVFTVCDECWDKSHPRAQAPKETDNG